MRRTAALIPVVLVALVMTAYMAQNEPRRLDDSRLGFLRLPPGFSISVYADQVRASRQMALAPDGTVFVGTLDSFVYALVDRDGDHRVDQTVTVASGLNAPNGVAFRDGSLYVGEISRVIRFDGILDRLASAPMSPSAVVIDSLPRDRGHGMKHLVFGPDGLLYLPVGAPCNICDRPLPYASILRMRPDGTGLETFARGVRNTVGMAWHPDTNELWFTDNGRDHLGDDVPDDELNHAPRMGLHFGYPYCHAGAVPDPEFGAGRSCAVFAAPAQKMGPHVAALGLEFYQGSMFPAVYQKQIFIAQHGSWNRSTPIGYRVMVARLEGNTVVGYEPFIEGWLTGRQAWGRPVDVLELADGSLLVSDDYANVIYRVTYGAPVALPEPTP